MPSSPLHFEQHLSEVFGKDLPQFLALGPSSAYIRVNPLKTSTQALIEIMQGYGFELQAVTGLAGAIRILHAPFDPTQCLHHYAGYFIKQSLSSQIPAHILKPQAGECVLDLCAAPGSKTTQLAAMMKNEGCLIANDMARKRMTPLAARLDANCCYNTVTMNTFAERLPQFLTPDFDAVLADVPCSGLGDATNLAENRYRYERCKNVQAFHDIQYSIALAGAKLLRVGGRLLYSTCSLNPAENEAIVHRLCSRWPLRLCEIGALDGICFDAGLTEYQDQSLSPELTKCKKVLPWKNDTQGFFVALLQKYDEFPNATPWIKPVEPKYIASQSFDEPAIMEILQNIEQYYGINPAVFSNKRFLRNTDKSLHFMNPGWQRLPAAYHRAGICLAKRRGAMWRLSHAAIQEFGEQITKNTLYLSHSEIHTLARTGFLAKDYVAQSPYPVIAYEPIGPLASGYAQDKGLLWRLPNVLYI